ncbi:MAG: ABC transporter substrate-binding protein [Candidatus Aminicenantes bacterium]|nr:ABC transporter substrate-binding protein [Candidatus Aminicenantes bacterium]MDH5704542.1 ABC transporter substrate-binding protein [Candidatus Aminicenantes bacterium]
MKRKKTAIVLLLISLNSPVLGIQEKIIKDDLGFTFRLNSPPQRIISLTPNITEILFALGLGEKVVGVTRFCDFPEEALKKEKIGGMVDPNLEKIKALNPDLIIGFRGNPLRTLERLRALHLPLYVLEMGTNIESLFSIIQKVGMVSHNEQKAEALIQSLRERYDRVLSSLREVKHEPKVFLSLHGVGFWTCGKESFLHDLIQKARGVNIAGRISRKWLNFNREQLIHENPEAIIVLSKSEEDFLKTRDWIKSEAHLKGIQAVASDRIYFLDENLATRPGPRLVDALEELARLLHPQCFERER